jgi:hypothetical protein
MTMQQLSTANTDIPVRAKPGPKPRADLEARIHELETRQAEIIDVLAGLSQAGRWLAAQSEAGLRA